MASKSAYIAFIQYIGDNGWVSRDSLKLLGYSRKSLWKYLSKMIEEGVVLATGKKRTQTYRLSPKGYTLFNGLYLNLTHFSVILSNLYNSHKQKIAILCFEWQREFYETMLERYTILGNSYKIYELSSQDFKQIVKAYEEYWKE